MKICHITSAHESNDIRIFVKECSSLAAAGYEVYLVAQGESRNENGVYVIGLGMIPKSRKERMTTFARAVYKRALEVNADIYHFHDPEFLPYGLKLNKKGKKVIFDSHEDVPAQILSKEWIPFFLRKIISSLYRYYEGKVVKKINAVVTATDYIGLQFSKRAKRVVTVFNYPKLDDLSFNEYELPEDVPCICYAGGINELRGLSTMLSVVEGMNVKLLLAGPCEENDKEKIEKCSNAEYLGILDRKGINELYKKCVMGLVLLKPVPNYVNSFPIKMFEYMAAGLPFVASDFPIWKEIVHNAGSGITVNIDNVDSIKSSIELLLSDSQLAKKMSQNGRNAIEKKYNWSFEENKLMNLYSELMRSR